uniref:Evasin n=1 Tax=Rhipicephalus pulchellus TaxID=72859 RepID=L7M8Y5_RHIPC
MALKYWFVFAAVLYARQWLSTTCEVQNTTLAEEDYDTGCGYNIVITKNKTLVVNCTMDCQPKMLMNESEPCLFNSSVPYDHMQPHHNYTCMEGICKNGTCVSPSNNITCWLPPPPVRYYPNETMVTSTIEPEA